MQITAQYTLTPEEALRGTRAFKRYSYGVSVGAGLLLLLMGYASNQMGSRGQGIFIALNGLLLLVMPEAVLRWARYRRGEQAYPPMEVALDDEGLTLHTEATAGSLAWSAFASIQRHSGFWIFRVSRAQAILVPERALAEADATELEAFLRGRKLLKG